MKLYFTEKHCPQCGAALVGNEEYVKCVHALTSTRGVKTCDYGAKDNITYEMYQATVEEGKNGVTCCVLLDSPNTPEDKK